MFRAGEEEPSFIRNWIYKLTLLGLQTYSSNGCSIMFLIGMMSVKHRCELASELANLQMRRAPLKLATSRQNAEQELC